MMAIRPDGIQIGGTIEANAESQFTATALRETFLGSHSEYLLDVGDHRVKADSSPDLTVGQACPVRIDPSKIVLVPDAITEQPQPSAVAVERCIGVASGCLRCMSAARRCPLLAQSGQ